MMPHARQFFRAGHPGKSFGTSTVSRHLGHFTSHAPSNARSRTVTAAMIGPMRIAKGTVQKCSHGIGTNSISRFVTTRLVPPTTKPRFIARHTRCSAVR